MVNGTNKIKVQIFLLLIPAILIAGFQPLYNTKNPQFKYSLTEDNNYRIVLMNKGAISYKDGFEVFLPQFLLSYRVNFVRYGSTGTINGNLYFTQTNHEVYDESLLKEEYYTSDYSKQKENQLDYLIDKKSILYKDAKSLSIEAFNLPNKISKQLNRKMFFKIKKIENNKLRELYYSLEMTLNKKEVDNFVKRNKLLKSKIKDKFKLLNAYLQNLNYKSEKVRHKKKQNIKNTISKKYKIDKKFATNMIEIRASVNPSNNKDISSIQKLNEDIDEKLKILHGILSTTVHANKNFLGFLSKQVHEVIEKRDKISNLINKKPHNYQYVLNNNLGVKHFREGKFKKSYGYLKNAYIMSKKNKTINAKISYNLAVWYLNTGKIKDIKKSIDYFLIASDNNISNADFNLGIIYYIGYGEIHSDKKSFKYMLKSAKNNNKKAIYNISRFYELGIGTAKNYKKAEFWKKQLL